MLGTIEELEKEIEQFQNNMASSGEMVALIRHTIESVKAQNDSFDSGTKQILSELKGIPGLIEKANSESNSYIQRGIEGELRKTVDIFSKEQADYISALEETKQKIQLQIEEIEEQKKQLREATGQFLIKAEAVPAQIKENNQEMQKSLVAEVDSILVSRNDAFSAEQRQYIAEMKKTADKIEEGKETLLSKYQEYLVTLENTNLAHLHEENQQLKKELKNRTSIIMAISIASAIIGIAGFFL